MLQRQLDQQRLRRRRQGLRLLGVDGSMVHLPLASQQAQHCGSHSGLPVARLSTLYDLCDNQTLHALLVPTDVDERGCAALHLDHAPDNSLIVFDRGYPAHWLFGNLRRLNQHFLMRLSTGVYSSQGGTPVPDDGGCGAFLGQFSSGNAGILTILDGASCP